MLEKVQSKAKILGIGLSSTSISQVLREARIKARVFEKNSSNLKSLVITTPNPEIILKALSDRRLYLFIERSDFAVPDGVGILLADFFLRLKKPKAPFSFFVLPFQWLYTVFVYIFDNKRISSLNLIKGRDLFEKLIALANKKSWRVVFLGDEEGSAQKAAEVLKRNYKKVKIFPFVGPWLDNNGRPIGVENQKLELEILSSINKIRPHLLFVAFGAPKQEKWLDRNLSKLGVGVAMVVGGAFDYVSGKVRKPPLFLEKRGLEWLWRLMIQPKRAGRIFKALFVFPFRLILYKAEKK